MCKNAVESRNMCKHARPANIQISMHSRAALSECSLGTFLIAKYARFLHLDNEDSDQSLHLALMS